ncbi:MAG: uroporphyrinogen-III synthase [Gammaproteobacteria bacterium]|nr:MAG: uroporphyrinogen-III synthase [Gammaproteobacteria bacterium]
MVVTRPTAQALPWAERLNQLGAVTTVISLLEIVPVLDNVQIQAIKNCILDLDLYDKAIFVSQNAVELGFEWIENYWPQLPIGIEFFAVGETTAKLLQNRGAPVTDLAQSQVGAMTSETLLQAPGLQSVAGKKIVIFRGVGGRPHIGEVLATRGALVTYCELYERLLPEASQSEFAKLLKDDDAQELKATQDLTATQELVVVVHSGEALENLIKIMNEKAVFERAVIERIWLLVPSQRIVELAKAAGLIHVYGAQNATEASMLQGLIDVKRALLSFKAQVKKV